MKKMPLALVMTALMSFPAFAEYIPVELTDASTVVNSFNGRFDIRRVNTFLVERWWGHNRLEALVGQANGNLTRLDQLVTALNELKGEPIPQNERYEALVASVAGIQAELAGVVNAPLRNGAKKQELARFYREAREKAFEAVKGSVALFSETVEYSRVAMVQETNRLQRKIPDHLVIRSASGEETQVTLAEGLRRMLQNTEDLNTLAREMRDQLNELESAFVRVEEAQARIQTQNEEILTEIETVLAQQAEARAASDAQFNRVFETLSEVAAKLDAITGQLAELRLEVISTQLQKYHYVRMNQTGIDSSENGRLTEFYRSLEDGIWELESRGYKVAIEIEVRSLNDSVGSDTANQRVASQRVSRVVSSMEAGLRSDVLARTQISQVPYSQSDVRRLSDRGVEIKVRWVLTEPTK